jgi:hypothetical protein
MRRGIDLSRKHGAFDTRWPSGHTDTSDRVPLVPLLPAAEVAEALEWDAFSARYFRRRRRHDLRAQSAYAAYKQGHDWRNNAKPRSARLSLVPQEPLPLAPEKEIGSDVVGTRRLLAAVAAVQSGQGADGRMPESDIPRRVT